MAQKHALGAVRSITKPTDRQVADYLPAAAAPLPTNYDLSSQMSPCFNQGSEGTCCPSAIARGLMDYFLRKLGEFGVTLSVRDLYDGGRQVQPVNGQGCSVRAALEYLETTGICWESDRPYIPNTNPTAGPLAADHRAHNRALGFAAVATDVRSMKQALVGAGPIVITIDCTDGLESLPASGIAYTVGKNYGLHAVCVTGYDDARQCYKVRNSWGPDWGQGGYFWLPYMTKIDEAYTLVPLITPEPEPAPPPLAWWQQAWLWVSNL